MKRIFTLFAVYVLTYNFLFSPSVIHGGGTVDKIIIAVKHWNHRDKFKSCRRLLYFEQEIFLSKWQVS